MYKRFLQDSDYTAIITREALGQLIRDDHYRFEQAEMAAEATMLDYLTENYCIEEELLKGKRIQPYDSRITYPVNAAFWYENKLHMVIKSIKGYKSPEDWNDYWIYSMDTIAEPDQFPVFKQLQNYYPGDRVMFNGILYECIKENGLDFTHIVIPGVKSWEKKECDEWDKQEYELWDVVRYEDKFYTLMTISNEHDSFKSPDLCEDWGLIGDYNPAYTEYQLDGHDYVVYNGSVFYPVRNPNPDTPTIGVNVKLGDPRNYNIKHHMLHLALYELHKLVAPHNVSNIRISDYEHTLQWLKDASKLKINPQIPRRSEPDHTMSTDWAVATFQALYDPNLNPWQV